MDATAAARQQRRLAKLASGGVKSTSVLVHHGCNAVFQRFRPYLADARQGELLAAVLAELETRATPVNVSQVAQLSPLRYPGGKTWLVPQVRQWLKSMTSAPKLFIEPFAGGAITGLTVAAEQWADEVVLAEIDPAVAALWALVIHGNDREAEELFDRISSFVLSAESVDRTLSSYGVTAVDRAFATIVKNRVHRGGILAPGASRMKEGENGKGLASRWYPQTLVKRMRIVRAMRSRLRFIEGDAFEVVKQWRHRKQAAWFIDPPYTAGGKRAGSRLYSFNDINHGRLFADMAACQGPVLMTYDDAPEVRTLAKRYCFSVREVPMKTTHHEVKNELLLFKA